MNVLATSWGSATGLTFVNIGKCATPAPLAYVSIFLTERASITGSWGGVGNRISMVNGGSDQATMDAIENRSDVEMVLGDSVTTALIYNDAWYTLSAARMFELTVAHEFGHTLGFIHERTRLGETGEDCNTAEAGTNNRGGLTPLDFDSIMNFSYCNNARILPGAKLLSEMDVLGAEMMYPKTSNGHGLVCDDGCFETPNGAVVRTTGSITIDWVRRGADVDPVWTVGSNTYQPSNGKLSATNLTSAVTSVTMSFPDAFTNPNVTLRIPTSEATAHPALTGGGTVTKSDELHTAIMMTTVGI